MLTVLNSGYPVPTLPGLGHNEKDISCPEHTGLHTQWNNMGRSLKEPLESKSRN